MSALRRGHASRRHELQIVPVLTLRQSLCGSLGESGEPDAPCGRDLSPYCADDARDVTQDVLSASHSRVESVHALWSQVFG